MNPFVAIDVETANADLASICQVGLARYIDGSLTQEVRTYIDPEDDFDFMNVSIHGITDDTVRGAPTFSEFVSRLNSILDDQVAICHTHFDRVAISQACRKAGLATPTCTWLDTARVVRRTWEQFADSGYGLANVCGELGYEFQHHDALEDAKAAAFILMEAVKKSGLDINEWLKRAGQPISGAKSHSKSIALEGNPTGPLFGEVLVFTGTIGFPRSVAAEMAATLGCNVAPNVNKKTTLLVVGDQDVRKLAGNKKSNKHRKAEDLIGKGQDIRILRESDFKELRELG